MGKKTKHVRVNFKLSDFHIENLYKKCILLIPGLDPAICIRVFMMGMLHQTDVLYCILPVVLSFLPYFVMMYLHVVTAVCSVMVN